MRHPSGKPVLTARSGLLYGAATGLLIGLIVLAVRPLPEPESVIVWRRFVLGGAAAGIVAGLLAGQFRTHRDSGDGSTSSAAAKADQPDPPVDSPPAE